MLARDQVVGVPSDRMGEEVCACIVLRAGATATAEEIRDFCKDKIAYFKVPKYVLFVASYPMTGGSCIVVCR
jgi:acyl-CoA synthetase (AMP-forming)/AMP-acid ligase II